MRMSWVGLVDEAQRLLAGAGVAVEHRSPGCRPGTGPSGRRHQRGEVGQGVGVAEGAVGAVRGEHLDDGLDVVLGHADGVAGEQLLDLDDVVDGWSLHSSAPPRCRSVTRTAGVVGTDWQVSTQPSDDLVVGQHVVDVHRDVPSTSLAMHVAQLPISQEKGGDMPSCRAVWRMVVPGWWTAVSVRPSSSTVTRTVPGSSSGDGAGGAQHVEGGEPLDADVRRRHTVVDQGLLDEVHERSRAAHEHLGVGGVLHETADCIGLEEPASTSRWWTTSKRSGCRVARASRASRKMIDSRSRLA